MKLQKLQKQLGVAKLYRRMASSRGETIEYARIDKIVQKITQQIQEAS